MKYEYYPAAYITDDLSIIEFISSGKRGHIRKRIVFQPTDFQGVYNLAFGDLNAEGEIDDQIVSDNGDRNRILATIVRSIDRQKKIVTLYLKQLFLYEKVNKKHFGRSFLGRRV
jgi:hypothetical protein